MKIAILHHADVPNIPTKIIVNIGVFFVYADARQYMDIYT